MNVYNIYVEGTYDDGDKLVVDYANKPETK